MVLSVGALAADAPSASVPAQNSLYGVLALSDVANYIERANETRFMTFGGSYHVTYYIGDGYTVVHNPTGYYLTEYNEDRSAISVNGIALNVTVSKERTPALFLQSPSSTLEVWTYFKNESYEESVAGLMIDVAMGWFVDLIDNDVI